jgi:hypothetical protein
MTILNGCSFLKPEGIRQIEQKYNARYVFECCLKGREGWVNFPAAIFYTEIAHPQGSNYLALYLDETGQPMITDGISATERTFVGVKADNGDIIYSRYRHDYRVSPDKSVWIDGGRDYLRSGMYESNRMVNIAVVGDHLEIVKL